MKKTWGDRVFDLANAVIMVFVCVVIAYPLYYVLIASFTDPTIVNSGKVLLYPEKIFMGGYQKIFGFVGDGLCAYKFYEVIECQGCIGRKQEKWKNP